MPYSLLPGCKKVTMNIVPFCIKSPPPDVAVSSPGIDIGNVTEQRSVIIVKPIPC